MDTVEVIQRLILSAVLSGLVGYERERKGRAAGFRTHLLVGVGSCLIMLTGIVLASDPVFSEETDPTRMAAQVVSGIGFLGAGTIIRFRASVVGLTTAAGVWAVGGVGLAVGAGFYMGALTATLIMLLTLHVFARIEQHARREGHCRLVVEAGEEQGLQAMRELLEKEEVQIVDLTRVRQSEGIFWEVEIHLPEGQSDNSVLTRIGGLPGIRRVTRA